MPVSPGAVVVGVDGTPRGVPALRWAAVAAHAHRAPLRIVHAAKWPSYVDSTSGSVVRVVDGAEGHGARIVAAALDAVREWFADLEVSGEVVQGPGPVAQLLVDHSADASALVVTARHRGVVRGAVRRALVGSVGHTAAARGQCPVVVLPNPRRPPREGAGVVVGVDAAAPSDAVLGYAFDHASRYGVPLRTVLCWRPPLTHPRQWSGRARAETRHRHDAALAEMVEGWQEKYPDVLVERRIVAGRAVGTLLAEARAAALLVVGARGRRVATVRPTRPLGSVTRGVLLRAAGPVAVVPR